MARILVVDDEEPIRVLLRRALTFQNHKVVEAKDGREALKLFRLDTKKFDAVITDMMMPESDGFDLVHELAGIDSEVKVIIMSGWFDDNELETMKDETSSTIKSFVRKPFTMEVINSVLSEVLNRD